MEQDKQMINILYVSPFSHIGGGEVSILTVINNLDRQHFRPFLVCYGEGPFVERAKDRGIETAIFRRSGALSELIIIWKLARYMKRNDIHLVHVNSLDIRAGIAAWLTRIPCIGHLRVIFPLTWRDRIFVRLSRVTIAVSRAVIRAFCKGSMQCQEKFVVIPNMVEVPTELMPASLRAEFAIQKDAPLIGMVGRMDPFKGHSVFIDAAAIIKQHLPAAKFFVIGGPSAGDRDEEVYLEAQKSRVAAAGLERDFIFTGFKKDILSVIAGLDVLVVPSRVLKRGSEGFGRVAIEAMAVGTPVILSNAGGLGEIIEDGVSGIVVPIDDPVTTAAAAIDLIRDKQKADSLVASARKRFDALYSVKTVDKLYTLYYDVAKQGRTII